MAYRTGIDYRIIYLFLVHASYDGRWTMGTGYFISLIFKKRSDTIQL